MIRLHRFRLATAIGLMTAMRHVAYAVGGVDSPPPPSAPHPVSFAAPHETRLDNGLRVIVAERPGLPLLAAQLVVSTGAESDPNNLAGTASMTGSLLSKGTTKMSAPQIASAIESLGGTIQSGGNWDSSAAFIVVMSDKAEPALSILADVIMHPAFAPEELDRLKNQKLDGLRVALQQPGSLSGYVTARVVFGEGGYGHPASGTLHTVQTIQREDVDKFYRTFYTPDNATLILTGDVTLEAGKAYAQRFFGEWRSDHPAPARSPAPPVPVADWKPRNVVIDMPQAGQAAVAIAKPAINRASPDYYSGLVANAALGTGFISRLNREIRIKRGLSYGARSSLETRRDVGPFVASAQTKNESAAEVAQLLQSELKRLATDPVKGDELKSRQAVLTGGFARSMETNLGVAGQISSLVTYNVPLNALDKFIPSINAVTTENITAFVTKYFSAPPSLIIVGKASTFLDALKKSTPDVEVIPYAELDLNSAGLTKAKR